MVSPERGETCERAPSAGVFARITFLIVRDSSTEFARECPERPASCIYAPLQPARIAGAWLIAGLFTFHQVATPRCGMSAGRGRRRCCGVTTERIVVEVDHLPSTRRIATDRRAGILHEPEIARIGAANGAPATKAGA